MNLLRLQYFAALAETENMTEAAARLGISRSNLSIAISKLETELGVELLEKAGRGVRLSKEGKRFYSRLRGPLAELELLLRESSGRNELSVMVGLPVIWSEPIAEFAARRPDVRVVSRQVSPHQVGNLFAAHNADFWLTAMEPERYFGKFTVQRICTAPLMLAVHKEHALASKSIVSIKELKEECFIFPTNEYTLLETYLKICKDNGFEPKIAAYAIFDRRIRAVAKGKGITFIDYVEKDQNMFRDIALLKISDVPPRNYYICWPKGHNLSPHAEDFLAFLKDYYAEP